MLEQLLKEINYKRGDVWIGNVIKHRPPENRDPLPVEIEACKDYLTLQLEILSPKLIVTLGRFAMNYFYPDGKISRDHGKLIKAKGYIIYPVYHPAAGLRNSNMRNVLEEDFLRIPVILRKIENYNNKKLNDDKAITEKENGQLSLW